MCRSKKEASTIMEVAKGTIMIKRSWLAAFVVILFLCLSKLVWAGEPSSLQIQFAQDLVSSVPGIENAWWSQDISLWVEIDVATFASNPKLFAQQIADKLSSAAALKFGHVVCVRVYYGRQRVLAKTCASPR